MRSICVIATRGTVATALNTATEAAAKLLSRPGNSADETRKARAQARVSRLIDAGTSALDAADVFTEQGDIDALRALREDVPSWVVATLPRAEQQNRQQAIDATLLELDRRMAPLLTGDEAAAVRVRLSIAQERARLEVATDRALNPSPTNRMRLAYATAATDG